MKVFKYRKDYFLYVLVYLFSNGKVNINDV